MAIDTPATIAILGAGPIGLEAGLYARFMGYDVNIYERGQVADNVLSWGHVKMFSPFGMNRSTLGLAGLQAQDESWQAPSDDALLTGREWVESYLLPLSRTDLVRPHVKENTHILGVTRKDQLKHERVCDEDRDETPFLLHFEDQERIQTAEADIVIDTTGTFGNHNWLGSGGLPAVGERVAGDRIRYDVPDFLGKDRDTYAGRQTLVVGAGYSAATNVLALAKLAEVVPGTEVTWLVRGERSPEEPIKRIADDTLAERDNLATAVAAAVNCADNPIRFISGSWVDTIKPATDRDKLTVTTRGETEVELNCDQVIANVGYHGDRSLYEQLQVHECYATGGPMKLAASLASQTSADCLDQAAVGAESLMTTEPNFYILGSKSYGRDSRFLMSLGFEQIRELFGLIGGRATLNLYADVQGLLSK